MSKQIHTLTDAAGTNTLLEFISTYFPFIDEPLKLTYRGRTYKILTTQARTFDFEDFFITHKCMKCPTLCCKNMYIPIGFEQSWPEVKLKTLRKLKPRRYTVWFNDQKIIYYIGLTPRLCKFHNNKACTIWDSNNSTQKRPMGCHFYPMTWYWWDKTVIFTKHCEPYICKGESMRYTEADFDRDLLTFEKLAKEIETVGFTVNYRPIDALKEQSYFSV
ncbi:MAG: hypothetical protein HWN65_11530 [Candidatus Helarchaeota archaeon]|nr:hypothetical protein [Candidatus Helarchaeota archaeon]